MPFYITNSRIPRNPMEREYASFSHCSQKIYQVDSKSNEEHMFSGKDKTLCSVLNWCTVYCVEMRCCVLK